MSEPQKRRPAWPAGLWLSALLGALACCAAPVSAQDAAALTGDWGGLRTRLKDRGLTLSLGYTSEVAANLRGGDERTARYTDQFALGASFDLHKLLGVEGAKFQISVTDRNGRDLGADAGLHTLQLVQEVYGRGQTWRMSQFWYQQTVLDGQLDLKFGRMTVGEDFAAFTCDFQNLTFCGAQPGNVRGELWYNWPVSQWGGRAKLALGAEATVQIGVYQANPRYIDDDWAHHNGLDLDNPAGTTGALIPLEFAWSPAWQGRPGSYKVGAWVDTSNANDVFLDTNRQPIALTGGTPLKRSSRSGVYVNFLQQISSRAKGRGASVFFNATQSDRATAASTDRQITLGLTYAGPFDGRPDDSAGIAIGNSHVNSRVADGLRLSNLRIGDDVAIPASETVGEVFYSWAPRKFFRLQPNVQYILHPGGINSAESAVILGLRTSVDF